MRRGGLDMYNEQSSEDFLCDTSSGSSGSEYDFMVLDALTLIATGQQSTVTIVSPQSLL
jgi:hypothetical protein